MQVSVGSKVSDAQVHLLPFTIVPQEQQEQQQDANVASYFLVSSEGLSGRREVFRATFRGREVRGVKETLPEGFVGAVLAVEPPQKKTKAKKSKANDSADEHEHDDDEERKDAKLRKGKVIAKFSEFIVWDHDAPPLESDPALQMIKFTKLADAIHRDADGKAE